MSDRDSVLQEFMAISGVGEEARAKFYLEAANWELSLALSGFFEGGDSQDDEDFGEVSGPPPLTSEASTNASDSASANASSNSSSKKPSASSSSRKIGRIHDFASAGSSGASKDDDDEDDDEDKQAFFAGGGAHGGSGQQVLGPTGKKKDPTKMIEDLFKAAKDAGAEEVDPGAPVKKKSTSAFKGQGFRLGQTETDHETIGSPLVSEPPPAEDLEVTLKMWKNGFSLDDGQLRTYEDPDNRDFLRSIQRGEIPNELIRMARGGEVGLNMEDHRQEEFVAPKQKFKAFGCGGQRLGSPDAGGGSSSSSSVAPTAAAAAAAAAPTPEVAASGEFFINVDDSAPTTNLQIRLADGSRLVGRFNHTHSVGDLRTFIVGSRPQYATANFVMMTTFPNKELTDEKLTLTEANLLNAVIVMRVK